MRASSQILRSSRRALLALLLLTSQGYAADVPRPTDYEVKAALAFNFLKFVEWPPEAPVHSSPVIELCVFDAPSFARAFASIAGKTVGGKRLEIRQVEDLRQAAECHVAFLGRSKRSALPELSAALTARGVLTIGDSEGFAERGLLINFYLEDDRVRFEVNLAAARSAGLKLSSRLLKLARLVDAAERVR